MSELTSRKIGSETKSVRAHGQYCHFPTPTILSIFRRTIEPRMFLRRSFASLLYNTEPVESRQLRADFLLVLGLREIMMR